MTDTGNEMKCFDLRYQPVAWSAKPIAVRCGRCLPCRIVRRDEWALRILLEQTVSTDSAFITLTYSPENLPLGGTLVKPDVQKFLKRLRKKVGSFRYFAAGEYGDKGQRPHYHLVLYGLNPMLLPLISTCWGLGFTQVGSLDRGGARYVAKYTTKKRPGERVLPDGRAAEFAIMSRRPGLGFGALQNIVAAIGRSAHSKGCVHGSEDHLRLVLSTIPGWLSYNKTKMPLDSYCRRTMIRLVGESFGKSVEEVKLIMQRMSLEKGHKFLDDVELDLKAFSDSVGWTSLGVLKAERAIKSQSARMP